MSNNLAVIALSVTIASVSSPALAADCTNILAPDKSAESKRLVTGEDLVELRDIGPPYGSNTAAKIFGLSPKGDRIAFQIRRADAASNGYCIGMFVMDVHAGATPIQVDAGGEFIFDTASFSGFIENTPPGFAKTITPRWSPDGQWIAYLRKDSGLVQVWRAKADGTGSAAVTRFPSDALDFIWAPDGHGLIVTTRPGLKSVEDKIGAEAKVGYLYDLRFQPASGNRPRPREPIPVATIYLDSNTGAEREATQKERDALDNNSFDGVDPNAEMIRQGRQGALAWLARDNPAVETMPARLKVRSSSGSEIICAVETCLSPRDMWWSDDEKAVFFQRRARGESVTSLYRWTLGEARPALVLQTEDLLVGCIYLKMGLICGYEQSKRPRRIIRIDLRKGHIQDLFDPNPNFSALRLGTVQRLHWKNDLGIPTFGDLVLPPDHRLGQRHPLVIVQYETLGFLRGGTGDEAPIQLYAAHGHAVLIIQRVTDFGFVKGGKTWAEVNKLNLNEWADRRSVNSALEEGIRAAVATGTIQPDNIGLTGLSDGASTVQYALIHSDLFKAAVFGSCWDEPPTTEYLNGLAANEWYHAAGIPSASENGRSFWQPQSLQLNAKTVNTPILAQLPDREYLGALAAIAALTELKKPIEAYVFPDEYHNKWQPEHRLAVFNRSVDWFDFWLKGVEDLSPQKREQYVRWREMRTRQTASIR